MGNDNNTLCLGIQKGGKAGGPVIDLLKSRGLEFRGAYFHEVFPDRPVPEGSENVTFESDMLVETTGKLGFGLKLKQLKNGSLAGDLAQLGGIIVGEDMLAENALPKISGFWGRILGFKGRNDITIAAWLHGTGNCQLSPLFPKERAVDQPDLPSDIRQLFKISQRYYTKYPKIVRCFLSTLPRSFGWGRRIIYRDGGLETMVQGPGDLAVDVVATGKSAKDAGLVVCEKIGTSTTVLAVSTERLQENPELGEKLRTLRELLLGEAAHQGPLPTSLLRLWKPLNLIPRLI